MYRLWTEAEKQYVRDNAGRLSDRVIAARLSQLTGRLIRVDAVSMLRKKRLNMKKAPSKGGRPATGPKKKRD